VLVVLRSPSMAQRVAMNGGVATQRKERTWTRSALAVQRQLLSELSTRGIRPRIQFSYSRVLNGFSAPPDARAIAVLERRPGGAGVYPGRAARRAGDGGARAPAGGRGLLPGARGVPGVGLVGAARPQGRGAGREPPAV